jgi:Zn-dependent membrane protease YugP
MKWLPIIFALSVAASIVLNAILIALRNKTQDRAEVINKHTRPPAQKIAQSFLSSHNINNIPIEQNPPNKNQRNNTFHIIENRITLDSRVYNQTDITAIGTACHEAAHAISHNNRDSYYHVRNIVLALSDLIEYFALVSLASHILLHSVLPFLLFTVLALSCFMTTICIMSIYRIFDEAHVSKMALQYIQSNDLATVEEYKLAKRALTYALCTYIIGTLPRMVICVSLLLLVF